MDLLAKTGPEVELMSQRQDKWLTSVHKWHDHFQWTPNEKPAWTPAKKPLSESRIALVTSAGVHLKSQPPFDVLSEFGDWSFRRIPFDTKPDQLMISDNHFDHSEPDQDINCVLPLTHIRTLSKEGIIGSVAQNHYGFMGFIPNPDKLIHETAPQVAQALIDDKVDIVFLTPGCAVCHQSLGLIQNILETSGMTTISVSLKPEVTRFMNVPRSVTMRYPYGYPVGPAFQPNLQREILVKCLNLIYEINEPDTIVKLSYRWAGSRTQNKSAADPRTQELINHIDEIFSLLKGIENDMVAFQDDEKNKQDPNPYKLNFYKSQQERAVKLAQILEEEPLFLVKGLRNLSGPIKYLREQ